ncbi:MFS transporter [Puniceicoccales bacterium CK1056]|uniref:MFS transporter n=1 Tax=Oceanipulchritudo coccoides TaxID=2706888 RepID=A0A6B2LXZ7_9BACT|nr:MFS transporter [Oceanipulchritudo coccoides]NDV60909.1 MFS transporter [Oceanipulchritudo coccoides]
MKKSPQADPAADGPVSLAPYSNLLKFGFFNATTWMIGLGTPLVLLAGQLGASSFEVGMAYAFVFLLLPVQIIATATLPRFGYKRQVIFGWASRGIFLLIPLGIVWMAPAAPQRWMVYALIASAFFFSLFRAMGSCGVMPLIYATLPESVRGRYFSTDQAVTGISGILTLLFCSLLFRYLPIYQAFFWQYLYAIAGVFFTIYFLSKVKDPPKPKETSLRRIFSETPKICLRSSPFRQYLVFMIASAVMGTAFVPLKAYYLKVDAGVGVDLILTYTAIQYAGAIIGTLFMRGRIDQIGVKPVFRVSLVLSLGISAFWYFLVTGHQLLLLFLPLAYFCFGIAASLWITAHLKYLPRVCDDEQQALHVSVHSAVVGLIGGLAPIAWGFLVKIPGGLPGVQPDRFGLYFLGLLGVQLGLLFYVPWLTSEHRERPSIQTGANLLRPFRYIGQLINFLPSGPTKGTKETTLPK